MSCFWAKRNDAARIVRSHYQSEVSEAMNVIPAADTSKRAEPECDDHNDTIDIERF